MTQISTGAVPVAPDRFLPAAAAADKSTNTARASESFALDSTGVKWAQNPGQPSDAKSSSLQSLRNMADEPLSPELAIQLSARRKVHAEPAQADLQRAGSGEASIESPPAAQAPRSADSRPADAEGLLLDLGQMALDLIGVVDPTPLSDGASALISLGRRDWSGVGISMLGIVPYVGDLAKLTKLGRHAETLGRVVQLARADPAKARMLAPAMDKLKAALDQIPVERLPRKTGASVSELKAQLREFDVIIVQQPKTIAPALPHGFASSEQFHKLGDDIRSGLARAGYQGVEPILQGSAVTGRSYRGGYKFDANPNGQKSDFDIALVSPAMLEKARKMNIPLRSSGGRTAPLSKHDVDNLGIKELHKRLNVQYDRKIEFMIYETSDLAIVRSPSILFKK